MSTPTKALPVSSCLQLDPSADTLSLYDAATERLQKAQAVIRTMSAEDHFRTLNAEILTFLLWNIDGLVTEALALTDRAFELNREVRS